MVELVDSLASGASARKGVRVRLPPRAPQRDIRKDVPFVLPAPLKGRLQNGAAGKGEFHPPMTCYSNFAVMLPFCRIWPSAFFKKVLFKECAPVRISQSSAYTVNRYICVFPFGGLGPAYR